ncbi:hypothetical protein AUF78_17680 [archaeon 13_1_20CM_2_51_12]|nr:MAG: hypothetical protein AUI97_06670 [Crenarchaeota archaeon 13_1_40CM_3_52_17]OLE68075.1 MAG: hypothetical protein AUF78_17680 [archaeon 13_1_20CM_2_51_12]
MDCALINLSRPKSPPDTESLLQGRGVLHSVSRDTRVVPWSFQKDKMEFENRFSKKAFENALLRSGFETGLEIAI